MKKILNSIALILLLVSCSKDEKSFDSTINMSLDIMVSSVNEYKNVDKNPRTLSSSGEVELVPSKDWTSGFYPGGLWYAYELSNNDLFLKAAQQKTSILEDQKNNTGTHDMGFKMYCSYGNAYRLTGDSIYRNVLITSAENLIKRFNPTVGCIRSWDHNSDKWDFPVIIDNMMNLELLMWAFKETGDSIYYNISVSHADITLRNHFRKDNSCYHVISYNPDTGQVENRNTHQGYSHASSWSRGQAWALYGYTMMYRETGLKRYLVQANAVADFILNHKNLPNDLIPYWDFDAPNIPDEPRDASAAAVISAALYELALFDTSEEDYYADIATNILKSLSSESYFSTKQTKHNFLLQHSTGSYPHNSEVDVPLIYADYYFLESLIKERKLNKNQ